MTLRIKTLVVAGFAILFFVAFFVIGKQLNLLKDPFGGNSYHAQFNFLSGLEVGAPVRLHGVKVGKVSDIAFLREKGIGNSSIDITLNIDEKMAAWIREDSRVTINMSGVLGEKYVEISSGEKGPLAEGAVVRGIDPPRLDEVISQSYKFLEKLSDWFEENDTEVTSLLTQTKDLLKEANQLLKSSEKKQLLRLVENLNKLTQNLRDLTDPLLSNESKQIFIKLKGLIEKAHQLDEKTLKKFFQEEGIKTKIF